MVDYEIRVKIQRIVNVEYTEGEEEKSELIKSNSRHITIFIQQRDDNTNRKNSEH